MASRSSTISLCMIVKDEEQHIRRCLASVKDAVDEIIIADTGSRDGTVLLAQSMGAKVLHIPWNHDFAAARNASLPHASCGWVLFLDADEELVSGHSSILREAARHTDYEGFFVQIVNYAEQDGLLRPVTVNPILRMFRNRPEYRFQGSIHEQIAGSIQASRPDARFHVTDAEVRHYGYADSIVRSKDKINRNIRLLRSILADHPDDPFHLYNLAVEHMRKNEEREALVLLRRARGLVPPEISYAHLILKYEARCLLATGQPGECAALCLEGLKLYPGYSDLAHLHAVALLSSGRAVEALEALYKAAETGPSPAGYHTEHGMGTYQTYYLLGRVLEEKGAVEEAASWYERCLPFEAGYFPPYVRLFRILSCTGHESVIPRLLEGPLHILDARGRSRVLHLLKAAGCSQALAQLLPHEYGEAASEAVQTPPPGTKAEAPADYSRAIGYVRSADSILDKLQRQPAQNIPFGKLLLAVRLSLPGFDTTAGLKDGAPP